MLALPALPRVHDLYLHLSATARRHFNGTLAGRLLFSPDFNLGGVAAALASGIAGGAALIADADAERLRAGLRQGLCDFVVGNLDEALRILKNELRRGVPVSVGLATAADACIAAMIQRGVQPDLVADEPSCSSVQTFAERGAILFKEDGSVAPGTSLLLWTPGTDGPRVLPAIARIAADSLDLHRDDTAARRRWLAESPRYLGRAFGGEQCLRMTPTEAEAFLPSLRSDFPTARVTRHTVAV